MKLNLDCIRDILLIVESNNFGAYMTLDCLSKKLPIYSRDELHYCCLKLHEGNYLELLTVNMSGTHLPEIKSIFDLTLEGHEFLGNIKNDTNWNKTKTIAKEVGSFSLNTVKDIAVQVISNIINSKF